MPPSTALLRSPQRLAACYRPSHGFLAPALSSRRLLSTTTVRHAEVTSTLPDPPSSSASSSADAASAASSASSASGPKKETKRKPLTPAQKAWLASALRVNAAGELAATLIYTAQTPPLAATHPHLRPLLRHMYDQEVNHFDTFNALITRHRIRPTALYPLWAALSYGLGWSTALMGREAAMCCTEAVETEIGDHYNGQIRHLLEMVAAWEEDGYEVGEEFTGLIATLRRIRDDELEHLDHAIENDAKKARPHWLMEGVIRLGCRGAIWVGERV